MKAVEEQQLLRSLKKIADNSERMAKSLEVIANAHRFESERSKRVNCGNCKNEGIPDICYFCRNAICWEPKGAGNDVRKEEVPFDDKV